MTDECVAIGPAELLSYWCEHEGYAPGKYLVLSAGDFNYGDGLNIIFKGAPIMAAMKLMGYAACTLGNADVGSFGKQIPQWSSLADFPLLAANLSQSDGSKVDWISPYTITTIAGVRVGIIGITTEDWSVSVSLDGERFAFQPYADTLRKVVPEVRREGAQVVIVVIHDGLDAVVELAKETKDLDIPLFLAGHAHRLRQLKVLGQATWVVESGAFWHSYSRVELDYDPETGKAFVANVKQVYMRPPLPTPDSDVENLISDWEKKVPDYYREIGYTATGLDFPEQILSFICNCMLTAHPQADAVLITPDALRQGFPSGPITYMTIYDSMNYENALCCITLTGRQLLDYLAQVGTFMGLAGLKRHGNTYLDQTGLPVDRRRNYRVLVTDHTCKSLDGIVGEAVSRPEFVLHNWRDPVVDWLLRNRSDADKPLESIWVSHPADQ